METISEAIVKRLTQSHFAQLVDRFLAVADVSNCSEVNSEEAKRLAKLTSDVLYQLFDTTDAVIQQSSCAFIEYLIDNGWFLTLQKASSWWQSDFLHPLLIRKIAAAECVEAAWRVKLLSKFLRALPNDQIVKTASKEIASFVADNEEFYPLLFDVLRSFSLANVHQAFYIWMRLPSVSSEQMALLAFEAERDDVGKHVLFHLKSRRELSRLAGLVGNYAPGSPVAYVIVSRLAGIGLTPSEVEDLLQIEIAPRLNQISTRGILLSGPFCNMNSWVEYLMSTDSQVVLSAIAENFWPVRQYWSGRESHGENRAAEIERDLLSRDLTPEARRALQGPPVGDAPAVEILCTSCTYYDKRARFCAVEPMISFKGTAEEKANCRSFVSLRPSVLVSMN